ncbi:MAG TPA: TIGR02234 family membrane protein [Mycobacterium sp.]|nr:TIGR02234 family membrane protein [Mycobacterium sp.]HPZ94988.1 TIGR02234 family membrane protein [Mycobacterium sp.]HQE15468.1 TIGR02234 family membrane protein [Mycobacterium sp.]
MIRVAQLLLILAAGGLWGASRMTWVSLRSSDGLGLPTTSTLDGATWSTALIPIAVMLLAAALAALAVRGWMLRAVAILVAVGCLALGYLGVSLIVMPDVAPRGAALAEVPIVELVGSQRHVFGAVLTLVAALVALVAAVLLMRSAAKADATVARYQGSGNGAGQPALSGRGMWDALDAGDDPTDTEGR